jgi:beta-glucanase (GH16 family)
MVLIRTLIHSLTVPLLGFAQIIPDCNPSIQTDCPAANALGASFRDDFKSESEWFPPVFPDDDRITYGDDGLEITLAKQLDNPAVKSDFYIMFGKLEVTLKAGPGQGIVSSFYLQSDDLDEIDWEWIGSDTTQVQTNFFAKGNVETYDRGQFHPVSQPQQEFHTYTIDWTKEQIDFLLDGTLIRTIKEDNPQGYPQSPMYAVIGIWAGGDPSNEPGTIEWAGGLTDYSQAPFSMYVKNVVVSDYSTGKEYKYSDQSGKWTSIEAVDGEVNGREEEGREEFDISAAGE